MSELLRWEKILPTQATDLNRLLDRAFGLTAPENYLSDFPVWDPTLTLPVGVRSQVGGWRGKELVSTASLRVVDYSFGPGITERLGMVGAVATDPNDQGRGLAAQALEKLMESGMKAGVSNFALWGNESSLYSKRGFRLGGVQLRTPLERVEVRGDFPEGYEVRTGWDTAILEILMRRKFGVLYHSSDEVWLAAHTGVEWRSIWCDGVCLAFAGWNRGIDLPGIIHEIEGTDEGKRALLLFLKKRYPHLELLHHPQHGEYGLRALAATEKLAQFYFVNPASLFARNLDSVWLSGMDAC